MSTIQVNGRDIDVSQFRNDWALVLMSQGIIVKLAMSWWRAKAPLKADELGLKFSDKDTSSFMQKYVKFGTESLLPPEIVSEIQYIESKARDNLNEHSFDTIWGKFVPYTAFAEWQDADKLIRQDFFQAAQNLCDKYDSILAIVRQEYRKMAKDVWLRLYKNSEPTESFIEDFVSKIISKIPSRTKIFASFAYETTYFIIPLPSLIEENMSKADDIKKQREIKNFNIELEKDTKKRIAEEYIKRKQEYIDGFLEATVNSMRTYVADLCDNVLQSINRIGEKKDVSKKQRDRIKTIIKKVKLLNFHDDTEISHMLKDLESEVDKFKGERDKGIIVDKLQKISDLSKEEFLPANFNPIISPLEV